MRIPTIFKVGLGLVMGSWALQIYGDSHLAIQMYREYLTNTPLAAFAGSVQKQSPELFAIAGGFSGVITWFPMLLCMGVGLMASSILCAIIEFSIELFMGFVKWALNVLVIGLDLIVGLVPFIKQWGQIPKNQRLDTFRDIFRDRVSHYLDNSGFQNTVTLFAGILTGLLAIKFLIKGYPPLGSNIDWVIQEIQSGNSALSLHMILNALLNTFLPGMAF